MKKKRVIVPAALLLAAALLFWFFYPLRSYIVMGVYSAQHAKESVMKQRGFSIDIPAGKGGIPSCSRTTRRASLRGRASMRI
jgi:hypothetical protein